MAYPGAGTSARSKYLNPQGKPLSAFQWKVYDLLIQVPAGKVTTYGGLAKQLSSLPSQGNKTSNGSPQAVGNALRSNPFAPVVPCHRVVNSDLYIGGFFGDYGLSKAAPNRSGKGLHPEELSSDEPQPNHVHRKIQLLKSEGIQVDSNGYLVGSREHLLWEG